MRIRPNMSKATERAHQMYKVKFQVQESERRRRQVSKGQLTYANGLERPVSVVHYVELPSK